MFKVYFKLIADILSTAEFSVGKRVCYYKITLQQQQRDKL